MRVKTIVYMSDEDIPQNKIFHLKNKHDVDDGLSSCTLCNMNSFQERRI